jgi:hypothetical protein
MVLLNADKPLLRPTPIDRAVNRALEFLHNTQNKSDGSWSAGRAGKSVAVTSLCVMSFLSAGHVPGEGKYGPALEKAISYVLDRQQTNGLLADEGTLEMYHHGIATLMLGEVCGMTNKELSKDVRRALEKAILVILKAQRTEGIMAGGWRYRVAHVMGSDISVSGWQIMALRSAKNLGCDVSAKPIDNAIAFLKRCQDSTGGFRYMPDHVVTVPCTGTAVLALELCGKDEHHSRAVLRGAGYLIRTENLPSWGQQHLFYGIYYGAQATFQVGGNYWSTYRDRLHRLLLENQATSGAWLSEGNDGFYGPNYSTAMSILALTVEYRYLPIYQRDESVDEKP